jgi:hypothetical protein
MEMYSKDQIKQILLNEVVSLSFEKKDGSIREMTATLIADQLPVVDAAKADGKPLNTTKGDSAIAVWDVDKKAWRSFRWDSLKTFKNVAAKVETG